MPYKLLLADDSVTIQRVIELTFADEDVQVIAVGDGKQAIDRIQTERPDIVLADVGMPERDGYEVAAFVKGSPEFAHVPVLLLTGAFEPIDEGRARSVGCDGVLVKPFEPQMVINRVKDLLAGKRPSGLWAAAPSAHSSPQRPAASGGAGDFDMRDATPPAQPTPPAPPAPSGSLEDYFDRLDAAISTGDAGKQPAAHVPVQAVEYRPEPRPPAAPAPSGSASRDALGSWDPELGGDPARPAPVTQPPRTAPSARQSESPEPVAPAASAAAPGGGNVALAEVFAALLTAEQGRAIAPPPVRAEAISDEVLDEIVRRVVDRLGDQAMRSTVLEVAERLVREEIARIKSHAR